MVQCIYCVLNAFVVTEMEYVKVRNGFHGMVGFKNGFRGIGTFI